MGLRRIFGPQIKLYNKVFHNLYTSSNVAWMIKLNGMRWVRYVAHMREMGSVSKISVRNSKGKQCGNMV
jgi:hypothetical protein